MPTIYNWRSSVTPTVYSGRPSIANEWWLLLINTVDRLLINATDHLIISIASSWTIYTGRVIP